MRRHIERILVTALIALLLVPAIGVAAKPPKPSPAPVRWRALIGEYVRDSETVIILESDGKL